MNDSWVGALRRGAVMVGLVVGAALAGRAVGAVFGDGVELEVLLGRGVVFGSVNAVVAVGLVFVHRAARVVNFSQAGFGALAAVLYLVLQAAWDWSFWLALPAAMAASLLAGLVIEVLILRRFAAAPRLVLTVVTIALGQSLLGLSLALPRMFGFEPDPETGLSNLPTAPPITPFARWSWVWGTQRFNGNQVFAVALAAAALVGVGVFLRFTRVGVAVRGSAENRERAGQLGIDVAGLSSVVWVIVAGLGAVAAIANTVGSNASVSSVVTLSTAAFGLGVLLRGLTAAIVARMDHLGVAAAAGVAIGIFEEAVRWATTQAATVDAVLLVVIVGALLLQRRGTGRVEADDSSSWSATEEIRPVPHELAGLAGVRRGLRRSLWALAAVLVAFPWVMSPSQTNAGGLYAIFGIVGVSLVVLTGWGGQISLGQFGFVAVGAVAGGWMTATAGLPFLLALPLASLVAAAVAVAVGLPALRIRGLFLAVSTLAFAVVAGTFLVNERYFGWLLPDDVERPTLFWIDTSKGERPYYYLCLVGLGLALFAANGVRRSRTGRVLIAMRENERTAQSFAIDVVRVRLSAFAISGFLAGAAGVLYVHHQRGISPASYDAARSVDLFLMAVLGGLGSVYAVLVGAVYFGTVTIVVPSAGGQLLASSLGVLVILLFFPTGLGSVAFRLRDAWLRRVAMRQRILVPALAGGRLKEGDEARVPISARGDDLPEVERRYELESAIGDQGSSQFTKVWRY